MFSSCTLHMCLHHIVAYGVAVRISLHPHARLLSLRVSLSPVSLPLLFHSLPVLCLAHHLQCRHRRGLKPLHSRTMRTPWPIYNPLTGYEPKLLDNFDYSETSCNDLPGEGELDERFRRSRIELQWKCSQVPSQRAVFPSPRSTQTRDKGLPLDTWIKRRTTGKHVWQSTLYIRLVTNTKSRNSSLHDSKCHRCGSSAWKYRATCREEVKNELGARHQCLQESRTP